MNMLLSVVEACRFEWDLWKVPGAAACGHPWSTRSVLLVLNSYFAPKKLFLLLGPA